jgi:hypothetical protein
VIGGNISIRTNDGAGIGGGYGLHGISDVGSIVIYNGTIAAVAEWGAGIGAGDAGSVNNIVIYDGRITVETEYGAGIGAGTADTAESIVGNLTIVSGTIRATSADGSGIGGGYGYNRLSTVQQLLIIGGDITATGELGAGIGGGDGSSVGNLTIVNGRIYAEGLEGAGIGAGYAETANSSIGNLVILNGVIDARGRQGGSGIGSGRAVDPGWSTVDDLRIVNGTVYVNATFAPGIGSGEGMGDRAISQVKNLTIEGGNVTSIGSELASGIGSGSSLDGGQSLVTNLTIVNGTITARGTNGGGIGSGYSDRRPSVIGTLSILNGRINASATGTASGIGGGLFDSPGSSLITTLRIGNADITASPGSAALRPINASSIVFLNSPVIIRAPSAPAFATAPSGTGDITVLYKDTTTAISEPLAGTLLQVGKLVLPAGRKYTLSVTVASTTKSVEIESSGVGSFVTTVSSQGAYRLTVTSGGVTSQLLNEAGGSTFLVDSSRAFFPIAQFPSTAPASPAASPPPPATPGSSTAPPANTPSGNTPSANTPPSVARTSAPSWSTFSLTASAHPEDQNRISLSIGAIVGISLGGVLVGAGIVGISLAVLSCRRPRGPVDTERSLLFHNIQSF